MPKKPKLNKRLDELFKQVQPEEASRGKSVKSGAEKGAATPPREESKPASSVLKPVLPTRAASTPVKTSRRATGALTGSDVFSLSVESVGGKSVASTFQLNDSEWATLLVVDEKTEREFSSDEKELIKQVTGQLSLALENANLFQAEQQRRQEAETLREASLVVGSNLESQEAVSAILEQMRRLAPYDSASVQILRKDYLEIVGGYGWENLNEVIGLKFPIPGNNPNTTVIQSREPLILDFAPERYDEFKKGSQSQILSWLGIPLINQERVIGMIALDSFEANRFTEETIRLVRPLVVGAAVAINNAQLFQETVRRAEETAALNELGRSLASRLTLDQVVVEVYNGIRRLLDAKNFYIAFYERETNEIYFPQNVTDSAVDSAITRLPLGEGITAYMIKNAESVLISNGTDEWMQAHGMKSVGEPAKSFLGAPLLAGSEVIGAMAIQDYAEYDAYTQHELDLLEAFSNQASIAIQNAKLFQETQRRAQELYIVNQVVSSVASSLDLNSTLQSVADNLVSLLSADNVGIALLTPDKTQLTLAAEAFSTQEKSERIGLLIPVEGNLATEEALRTRKAVFIKDIEHDPLALPVREALMESGTKNLLIMPLLSGQEVIGTFGVAFQDAKRVITQAELRSLETIVLQTSTAIQKIDLFGRIESSEHNLRSLFSAMDDVVIVINKDGRYELIAPTNPSLLVRPPEEMLGKTFHEFLPKDIADRFLEKVRETLASPANVSFEYELDIAGEPLWFFANLTKLDESRVFWVARDITEQKKAEEAIRRRNEYLAVSAEIGRLVTSILDLNTIFARTVNLITDRFGFYHAAIYIVEETGFNALLKEATGEAGQEMKKAERSLPLNDKTIVGSVALAGNVLVANNAAENPLFAYNPLLPETRAEAAIPLRISTRIIGVIDIQARRLNAFDEDEISVLQTLSDQVAVAIDNARSFELSQQAVMEMREVDRLKSQFLANMSHELRTPLNSIIGFSRVILKGIDGPITDLMQQDLTAIYNSGQHLLGLINDILDLAKIEAGKMELAFDEVNIADLIHSVTSTMTGLIKDKQIEMKQFIEPNLPSVRADAIRVRQVMINLLSNAAKFTEEGSISVTVNRYKSDDGKMMARVTVRDTGPGISPADQAKLFQPFSQVDASPTRKSGGTGLGLSICQQLISMHGGKIWVESRMGMGSAFHFTLPLYHRESEFALEGSRTILAIDDDMQVISLYERYLNPQGYQVAPLTEPARAVEYAKRLKPLAITLDIMMPGMDGWSVLESLKLDPETRNIPVVICSIVEDIERGYNLGASDYLVKPILEEDLVNSLDRLNADGSIREVLIIDDNPNDLRLIGKMLIDDGHYKPILAEGGRSGWNIISSGTPPHAIILDLFMPEMDGFEIIERMQADRTLRDIPTIVISGMDVTPEQKDQLKEFGQRLLTKGAFNERELLTSIQRSIERYRAKNFSG
jgi:PAS domain S-box-containing protein